MANFELVAGVILILMGAFRLMLFRSGKIPVAFSAQRYFPYIFFVVGGMLILLGLRN